jgi:hypothetical protein
LKNGEKDDAIMFECGHFAIYMFSEIATLKFTAMLTAHQTPTTQKEVNEATRKRNIIQEHPTSEVKYH